MNIAQTSEQHWLAWILKLAKSRVKEMEEEKNTERALPPTYCVTGANGYIGSWLVKVLLQRGYMVHATVRDLAKSLDLLSSWRGADRLRLFKADLREEGSFDEAVRGCHGVFHVAASMEFNVAGNEDIENYARCNIIDPAVEGTLNLLKSCSKSNTVKRVIFTSSISTLTAKDRAGKWRKVVDETCQTPIDHVWNTKPSGWIYVLSKRLTEEAAFKYAKDNAIDLISVITTTVAGAFLTSSVPPSIQVLLSPITGDTNFFSILSAVIARMGSIALVHIADICDAHIFLMEQTRAEGRYICCAHSCVMSQLINHLAEELAEEKQGSISPDISSKKLRDIGFKYKHSVKDMMSETITCCLDQGFLPHAKS
ncbi:hypothetical protein SADUNF_Sadunf16G0278300 [Salix dunnii]|uniref:NAD-dependent epimerase/dehydratase domain-containing protein n=1 Tax=Salix dunnii TaxID=1413687 RepID=A0A835JAU4_9ROSI|nr:hypothetical protein SADUNF_Sadunf16G0278300 [Salix dunnii]